MISVIATVFNEGENMHRLLTSLQRQSRQPDEIIIVDGGSSDNTVQVAEGYCDCLPLIVLVEPGANISQGRNRAIEAAQGDIIAITDAGVTLPDDWLQYLVAPFERDNPPDVVSGFFRAAPQSRFEVAMGATVLPLECEINPATFLPSSRSVAVRRAAWAAVGGYPEWLDYCEDLIFDLQLKKNHTFAFAPTACVEFRPRSSLRDFFIQYYRYARGDGKADLWRKRHAIRYVTYLVFAPLGVWAGARVSRWLWLPGLLAAGLYVRRPYRRLRTVARAYPRALSARDWAWIIGWVPVIRAVGDVAKMLGYPIGWLWRLRHRAWRFHKSH